MRPSNAAQLSHLLLLLPPRSNKSNTNKTFSSYKFKSKTQKTTTGPANNKNLLMTFKACSKKRTSLTSKKNFGKIYCCLSCCSSSRHNWCLDTQMSKSRTPRALMLSSSRQRSLISMGSI